jgi:endothelin-converting enzyme
METETQGGSYNKSSDNNNSNNKQSTTERMKCMYALLAVVCALLLGVTAVTIWLGVSVVGEAATNDANDGSGLTTSTECTTPTCKQLAVDIANSRNTSVDPCDDFFHYACDNWNAEHSWNLFDHLDYNPFSTMDVDEYQVFLDALFYDNADMMQFTSVQKAAAYLQTCYQSAVTSETLSDPNTISFFQSMMDDLVFTDVNSTTWDQATIDGFQSGIARLVQIKQLKLFDLQISGSYPVRPLFQQVVEFWQAYSPTNLRTTYEPLFESLFGLTTGEADAALTAVITFMDAVQAITTPVPANYQIPTSDWSTFTNLFVNGAALNYSRLVFDVYEIDEHCAAIMSMSNNNNNSCKYATPNMTYIASDGPTFFSALSALVDATAPFTMQVYLAIEILTYYLGFPTTLVQNRLQSRTQFCYFKTVSRFPFVFNFILSQKMYSDSKQAAAQVFTESMKAAVRQSIADSLWVSTASKSAALTKIDAMQLYVGSPPNIQNGSKVDAYYEAMQQSLSLPWTTNTLNANDFTLEETVSAFYGRVSLIGTTWPGLLSYSNVYGQWLTGVNAFYYMKANWFIIPIPITQQPFFDVDYPAAINFGGLGSVCGHEMNHGFDTDGTKHDSTGAVVASGSIFSSETQASYQSRMQCFIDQYSGIIVGTDSSGNPMYNNGARTLDENVADNAGTTASWHAWKSYTSTHGSDKQLTGLDLTPAQLFWFGWARAWCDTYRPDLFNPALQLSHSPNYARVIGTLQNNAEFAKAYNCPANSRMVSTNPCVLW